MIITKPQTKTMTIDQDQNVICTVVMCYFELTGILWPRERDLNLWKILQRPVHVLLLHLTCILCQIINYITSELLELYNFLLKTVQELLKVVIL